MTDQRKSIDISDAPEILRMAEEIRRAGEPRVLRWNGEDVVMVVPLPRAKKAGIEKPTADDFETFRRAAGSWADIDTDTLIKDIYRAREEGTRHVDHP